MKKYIDISKLYGDKFIKSLIFSDLELNCLIKGEYDNDVLNFTFITVLKQFIDEVKEKDYLEKEEIERLFNVINYLRINYNYKDMEDKKICYSYFNDFITILNSLKGEKVYQFYSYEIAKRFIGEKIKNTRENFFNYKKMIKQSFGMDFIYLNFVIGNIPEEALKDCLNVIANDINYFMFLNSLLFDEPDLLDSVILIERTQKIIRVKQENDEFQTTEEEKKMVKKYKKLYKKIIGEA